MAAQFPSFESRTLAVDGVNIHYVCGGSGPPLVLGHGLGSSAAVEVYYNLEALAARHRGVAIELPGLGKSDKPPPASADSGDGIGGAPPGSRPPGATPESPATACSYRRGSIAPPPSRPSARSPG